MSQLPLIIAIDDSELVLKQLRMLISNGSQYQFAGYNCGLTALQSPALSQATLILLDINMPSVDGVEMLRKFAELEISAPIALLSGETSQLLHNTAALARLHGLEVIDTLEKPLSAKAFRRLCQQLQEHKPELPLPNQDYNFSLGEILEGIKANQFIPYYQAKYHFNDDKALICGAEVLARWCHPQHGVISPIRFIDKLEFSGEIHQLSNALFIQLLSFIASAEGNLKDVSFSFNLSVTELSDITLPEKLATLCDDYGVDTQRITLELTESSILENLKQALDVLLRLKLRGFTLSIDDFGTGYASMKQLNELPFDELKIDRCFVDGCAADTSKQAIIASTCEMAEKLGLKVVAEGVENLSDLNALMQYQINQLQGFYFSTPCHGEQFLQSLRHNLLQNRQSHKYL